MSLTYYPSEGLHQKVGLSQDGEYFGISLGGKILSKIKNNFIALSNSYFEYISTEINSSNAKWFYGNITDYHFLNGLTIYRCLYVGNSETSDGLLDINGIDVSLVSYDFPNIQNYVTVSIATDGIFNEFNSKNSLVLQREDDPDEVLSSRTDWTSVIPTAILNPGHFYKIWIRIQFQQLTAQQVKTLIPQTFQFYVKIKNLLLPIEKTIGRFSSITLAKTSLSNLFDKNKNFVLHQFNNVNFNDIYKILNTNNLIHIFTLDQNNLQHRVYNKNKLVNVIYVPNNFQNVFSQNVYQVPTIIEVCENNVQFPPNDVEKKYLINIFSSGIDGLNKIYIFYNKYVPKYTSNFIKKYGKQVYYLKTFCDIVDYSVVYASSEDILTYNISDIKSILIEKNDFIVANLEQINDGFFGFCVKDNEYKNNYYLHKIVTILEKDLLLNKVDINYFSVPEVYETTEISIKNKIHCPYPIQLKFNKNKANIYNTLFNKNVFYYSKQENIKTLYYGPPHQQCFHLGHSFLSFDWNEHCPEMFSITYAFGFSPHYFVHKEDNQNTTKICSSPQINTIKNVYCFNNNSYYDDYTTASSRKDFNAIDYNVFPLLPGSVSSIRNISNYEKGINGIFIDIYDINKNSISLNDFQFKVYDQFHPLLWNNAPNPIFFNVYELKEEESNRIYYRLSFIWKDNTIKNTWLECKILANQNTKLTKPFTFYIGNLVGIVKESIENNKISYHKDNLFYWEAYKEKNLFFYDVNRDNLIDEKDKSILENIELYQKNNIFLLPFLPYLDLSTEEIYYNINHLTQQTFSFDRKNPNHYHLMSSSDFMRLSHNEMKLPDLYDVYNLPNNYFPIFALQNPKQSQQMNIFEFYYNFSLKKWRIKRFLKNMNSEIIEIFGPLLSFSSENVITMNIHSQDIYSCPSKKHIVVDVYCNGMKLFSGDSYSIQKTSNIVLSHNWTEEYTSWVSFFEIRDYLEHSIETYASLLYALLSSISWFSLSEELPNNTNNFSYKRILKLKNYDNTIQSTTLFVPIVLQGFNYKKNTEINNEITRNVFDFSKINVFSPSFLFTYEHSNNNIEYVCDSYILEKDMMTIWLKLKDWNGENIVIYYGGDHNTDVKNSLSFNFYQHWFSLWNMDVFIRHKKEIYSNSSIYQSNGEMCCSLVDTIHNNFIVFLLKNLCIFNNIPVYKHSLFNILMDDVSYKTENISLLKDFIKNVIQDIKPAHSILHNIKSVHNYVIESSSNKS